MAEIWTVSDWSIGEADPDAFVAAFRRFVEAATTLGGAREGMILQDTSDPAHFVVVRRWDDETVLDRWSRGQHQHADELLALAPEGGNAAVLTKVADLDPSAMQTSGSQT